jgi:diguanylate cyclase (GGDEF)-like protein
MGILLPILMCFLTIGAAVAGFAAWVASDLDSRSMERQRSMVEHVLSSQLIDLSHDQESLAVWDDAVVATKAPDLEWLAQNYGEWSYNFNGHDRVMVLGSDNAPIYAGSQGLDVAPGPVADDIANLAPLISSLRVQLRSDDQTYLQSGRSGEVPRIADFSVIDGTPAIVSIMPIVTDSGELVQVPGQEPLLVSVQLLDDEFAERLIARYLIGDGQFVRRPTASGAASYPLINGPGRIIAFFEWQPDRPGERFVARTAPALALAFALATIVMLWLVHRLWRSTMELQAGRLTAQYQASHDSLTGLPNRSRFDEVLGRTMMARRPYDQGVALLMLDLDRFKQVNDTLGHQSGDDLIRAVSQRLTTLMAPEDMLARLGGDEFGVIHFSKRGLAGHLELSQRMIDAVGKPFEILGSEAFVGVSIGIVVIGTSDSDRREITRKADIALYEAKSTGRNRAVVYEDTMDELLQNRHTIEAELREALRRDDQLSVAFQPLFSREGGSVRGAEALARWTHPTLGIVSPARFVPVAETTGLIEALGEFVLREACQLGARHPGMTIAVNISPAQLRNPKFPERLFDMLLETGMAPSDLEVEITESILLDDEQVATAALRTFRDAGIRIALDDFGTGYSSLNYLKRYPVDCIKIDRSFVSQLEDGNVSVAIVQAMVTLAHALNIEVTAEGVETDEQRRILTQLGCNTFQGFLFSAPVALGELEAIFARTQTAKAHVA